MSKLITAFPPSNSRGQLTLAGAINKYWDRISAQWHADSTIYGNIADYERRILEIADRFKAVSDYTYEDCEAIVATLSNQGNYMENTENHYRHLLRLVFENCFIEGEIKKEPYSTTETNQVDDNRTLIRSFTRRECGLITEWCSYLKPETV